MNIETENEIQHEGKTLVRLPDINDIQAGDFVMISGKLFDVDHSKYGERLYIWSDNNTGISLDKATAYIQEAYGKNLKENRK